jgi:hypothetical protein
MYDGSGAISFTPSSAVIASGATLLDNARAQRPRGEHREPSVRWSAKFDALPVFHGLLDHFVRSEQNRLRDRQPKRLRSLEVDHHLELPWLLDW